MRFLFLFPMAIAMAGLGGCAEPLDVRQASSSAASIVGTPASQIEFIGYADFGDVPPGGKHPEQNGGNGWIVLTNNSMFLLNGGDFADAKVKRRIKYTEIGGVDVKHVIRAYQLQVIRGNVITVVVITKNKALIDEAGTKRAAEILQQHGVPAWKSEHYYQPKIPPPDVILIPVPILH